MNLEEKAETYHVENYNGSEIVHIIEAYKNGYQERNYELIVFLQANQKATVKHVLEHLNGMK